MPLNTAAGNRPQPKDHVLLTRQTALRAVPRVTPNKQPPRTPAVSSVSAAAATSWQRQTERTRQHSRQPTEWIRPNPASHPARRPPQTHRQRPREEPTASNRRLPASGEPHLRHFDDSMAFSACAQSGKARRLPQLERRGFTRCPFRSLGPRLRLLEHPVVLGVC